MEFIGYTISCFLELIYFNYFIDYAVKVMLNFPPFPSPPRTPTPSGNPPTIVCVMRTSSLATLFPMLHFTSPWLFYNYLFVLLYPLTSSPILPLPPFIWQSSG